MSDETIVVEGLRETIRAFSKLSGGLDKEFRASLRAAAKPVQDEAREIEGDKWGGASVSTIGIAVRQSGVAVTQRARKVTGKRPDYGALQQNDAFDKALADKHEEVEELVGKALDGLIAEDIG